MSCTIFPSDDDEYIIIRVEGNITRKKSLEWTLEANALGRQLNISRYLMDLRKSRNVESNAEGYRMIYVDIPSTEGIDKLAKVAVLVTPGDNSHNFIEVIANNAGLDITIFNNLELAQLHLATTSD